MELNRGAIMKAYAYSKTGPAEEVFQIQEVHLPEPGPGEICVRMQWTGVNPSDVKTRSGHIPSAIPFPRVPHSEITYRIFRTFAFAGGSFQSERTEDGREKRQADGERDPHR